MTENAVLLNISDMIDLAIGTPEVGVVDFNMLQTVLHCLAQQLRILGKNVEVRGSLVSIGHAKENVQTINIAEYAVDTDTNQPSVVTHLPSGQSPSEDNTILVVERVKKGETAKQPSPPRTQAPPTSGGQTPQQKQTAADAGVPAHAAQSQTTPHSTQSQTTPHATQSQTAPQATQSQTAPHTTLARIASQEKLSLVTVSKFNVLENTVADLKNRVYGSMPKNEEILEEVRSQTNLKAIQDMWTNLNVSSRLEAAEAGINKLSSLVQDLIKESTGLQEVSKRHGSQSKLKGTAPSATQTPAPAVSSTAAAPAVSITAAPTAAAPTAAAPTAAAPTSAAQTAAAPTAAVSTTAGPAVSTIDGSAVSTIGQAITTFGSPSEADISGLEAAINQLQHNLDNLTQTFYTAMSELQTNLKLPTPISLPSPPPPAASQPIHVPHKKAPQAETRPYSGSNNKELMERMNDLEKRVRECCEKLGKGDGVITDQLNSFQDQLEYLSQQVAHQGALATGSLSPDLIKDLQGLMQLFQTVQDMQAQLKKVHETALQLAAEKEDRQSHINALLEQIELLKTIKLDREDMTEAMADKADLRMLARKVSHDQFEIACNDLSRGLEHAFGKLNTQEALWQQALDDIQREIETKLDKIELSPVKDFFNNKLKQLQEHLKQMASLRREAEAAGTKRKLLRDLNCLSCDANAVMATEAPPSLPVMPAMPTAMSMKPYLSYELDAIRKAQASNLPQRNMHDWENIDKQMNQQPAKPQRVRIYGIARDFRSGTNKHLCNRYCGGSHTTTTPAQRVARVGHFVKQWGPDVLPLSSGMAAGDDGRMYRVSPSDGPNAGQDGGADQTCTPKEAKKEKPEIPDVPINEQCKCLEGPGVSGRSAK